uniref:Uncharacterized protein n=1 Tax=Oryza glumipatula TaxID=40148 RepID=A0A0D9YE09_9ORYZ
MLPRSGEALVSYDGFTVASGRVPGFCVPGKGVRKMPFLAWADGVGLPEQLRDRTAIERATRRHAAGCRGEAVGARRRLGAQADVDILRAEDG